jgi:ribosomal protein S18 acetylase RimI-like enzyme
LLDGQRTDAEEVSRLLEARDSLILLGEIDGALAASVHLESQGDGIAYLGMLAVRPEWQGLGLGRRMIAAAEARAVDDWGAAKMVMTVIDLRQELIAFYGRCGYARTGRSQPFPTSEKFGIQKVPGLRLEYLAKVL